MVGHTGYIWLPFKQLLLYQADIYVHRHYFNFFIMGGGQL